jgi:hypothetical protein
MGKVFVTYFDFLKQLFSPWNSIFSSQFLSLGLIGGEERRKDERREEEEYNQREWERKITKTLSKQQNAQEKYLILTMNIVISSPSAFPVIVHGQAWGAKKC